MDCFVAELVIGPATSGRTRWLLAMTTYKIIPATRSAPEFCQPPRQEQSSFRFAPGNKEGSGAPKGACQPLSAHRRQVYAVCATRLLSRQRASFGARSPSGASPRHSPAQSQPPLAQLQNHVSWDAAGAGVLPASGLSSPASSSQTDPFAGQVVPQSRLGAGCISARGHRTCSAFRS
jgi:hypothetical protein